MNKTHERLKSILKREQNVPREIEQLYESIKNSIHGNTNINTQATRELINKIILETELNDSKVVSVELIESTYNPLKEKGLDTPNLSIYINTKGKYNGSITIKTSFGHLTKTREPIYYVNSYDKVFLSDLEEKIIDFYQETYPTLVEELFLDIAINKKKYLRLDTRYKKYELWDNSPREYSDTMSGYYVNDSKYMSSFYNYGILGRVNQYKNIKDFASKDDCANWTTESVEWRRYYL